ncbi:hypothetical protein BC628DRAFT_1418190 [Trametes gibbosa]|nr:hypothetical protein BC628DRAFT_1418190 [Trametes gibbosa]
MGCLQLLSLAAFLATSVKAALTALGDMWTREGTAKHKKGEPIQSISTALLPIQTIHTYNMLPTIILAALSAFAAMAGADAANVPAARARSSCPFPSNATVTYAPTATFTTTRYQQVTAPALAQRKQFFPRGVVVERAPEETPTTTITLTRTSTSTDYTTRTVTSTSTSTSTEKTTLTATTTARATLTCTGTSTITSSVTRTVTATSTGTRTATITSFTTDTETATATSTTTVGLTTVDRNQARATII